MNEADIDKIDDINNKVWVIIPAAGSGSRMNSEIPKQYLTIKNKTILEHTLACFTSHPEIAGLIVALSSTDTHWDKIAKHTIDKPVYTVQGGDERSDSVILALEYLCVVEQLPDESWVMVHDAARPCLVNDDLNALLMLRTQDYVGGILARPVSDTMKRAMHTDEQPLILKTESRDTLWHALTPQMFRLGKLRDAYRNCQDKGTEITDDASAIEAQGDQPALVAATSHNIKLTHPADLELISCLLNTGDAHA